ncbi:glycoside hydrolase [Hymenobacter arcticus]
MKTALFFAPKFRLAAWAAGVLALALGGQPAFGQAEVTPWGNINGLRVSGQLQEFESSLQLVTQDWAHVTATAQERQRPGYTRQGVQQLVTTRLDSLSLRETVEDLGPGKAAVTIDATALAATNMLGAFFSLALPQATYAQAKVQLLDAAGKMLTEQSLANPAAETQVPARRVRVVAGAYQVELAFAEPTQVLLRRQAGAKAGPCRLYVPIQLGALAKGQTAHKAFTISANGPVDRAPIHLALNPAQPGRPFAGFGGNFRLQSPKNDPQVIDYCLQNLRVAWGRVEMPWQLWQPDLAQDPTAAARQGQLHPHVQESMEMAQRLSKKGMPVIVTAWSAPQWAIVGQRARGGGPGPDGIWGNPLDKNNMQASYKSIADYILYLKEKYGVEVAMFSFNESDLGINIRQTGQEHDELIKGLGAYFVSRGLKTKLLLGDNSDATTYEFIYPALRDPAARPYIGAVSFHSWRGCDDATLAKWAAAAREIKLPLLVGEGSIDAQAWGYPAVFEESTYALQEITLYTRLLAQCQPLSILQWQLTSDYSPLAGGGIYGNPAGLHPTQRFWNLKQLANTPENVVALPLTADRPKVAAAALGNPAQGVYALHLVNNGATRPVTLTGLPATVKALRFFVTDKTRAVQEGPRVAVAKGTARFTLEAGTYVTLESK